MERTFSVVLSELRKERGLSQKEASMQLEVSQALLSHYEKGIRECGQDFLVRAADFYGVTCDYLLGRSTSRTGFNEAFQAEGTNPEDSKLSTLTVFRATAALREQLQKRGSKDFDMFHAIALYNLIVNEVNAGNLPSSWAGGRVDHFNEVYQYFMFSISQFVLGSPEKKQPDDSTPPPECVQTIAREVTGFLRRQALEKLPLFDGS